MKQVRFPWMPHPDLSIDSDSGHVTYTSHTLGLFNPNILPKTWHNIQQRWCAATLILRSPCMYESWRTRRSHPLSALGLDLWGSAGKYFYNLCMKNNDYFSLENWWVLDADCIWNGIRLRFVRVPWGGERGQTARFLTPNTLQEPRHLSVDCATADEMERDNSWEIQ